MPRSKKKYHAAMLRLVEGQTHRHVADAVGVNESTVSRWAKRMVRHSILMRVGRSPALYAPGPAYRQPQRAPGRQSALDAFGVQFRTLAYPYAETVWRVRPEPEITTPPSDLVSIRFHNFTVSFPVTQGPDPRNLKWKQQWVINTTPIHLAIMPTRPYGEESGATVRLAWGKSKRTITVAYPPIDLVAHPRDDIASLIRAVTTDWTKRARRWVAQELGYKLGDATFGSTPHLATQDVGERLLVKGVGYIRLTPDGDAWIDESVGPELETTSPAIMSAWAQYAREPEALIASLVTRIEHLERVVLAMQKDIEANV